MSCNEWKEYKLEELCEYRKDKVKIDDINLYNYISTENMMPNKGGIEIASSLPNSKTVARYLEGDILISNIRPYFKKIWYAKNDGGNSNDVLVFKNISKDKLNNTFLYYLLSSDNFFDYVMSTAKGTKMPRGDKDAIMRYNINLPSLEEQEKIANILSSLDDKIELNNEMNKTLEEMAQSIFKRWFVDFEFPNEDGEPYKSSDGEMVDSELGMIPKGWEVGTLDNLGVFKNGKGINQDLRNDNGKNLIYGSNGIIGKTDEVLQKDNCIIIGRVGAYCGSIQLSLEPCWVTDNAIMGTAKQRKYLPYLHRFLLNYPLRESAGGSAQPLINQSILKSILTVMPPNELFDKYYDISKEIIYKIDDNNKENIMLSEIRDSLLPKLMSGEISVN